MKRKIWILLAMFGITACTEITVYPTVYSSGVMEGTKTPPAPRPPRWIPRDSIGGGF